MKTNDGQGNCLIFNLKFYKRMSKSLSLHVKFIYFLLNEFVIIIIIIIIIITITIFV